MTSDRRFERDLPELFAQLAPPAMPDYRDDVVQQTARMRQRPAWTFPERWLPVDISLTPARGRPRFGAALAFVAIALLLAAMLIAYVGTRQRALPAPFGPAANGVLYYSSKGDIYALDTVTSTPRAIVTGADSDGGPMPSRDGQRIIFTRGGDRLVVAHADGSGPVVLPGTYPGFKQWDWSPTSEQVALLSSVNGADAITIVETDGSGSRTVPLPMTPIDVSYLPDGRLLVQGTTTDSASTTYTLSVVDADGTHLEALTTPTTERDDVIDPQPAPDGRSVVFHQGPGSIHIIDLASKADRVVDADAQAGVIEDQGAQFSPDSSHILFTRFTAAGSTLSVIPATGGPAVAIGELSTGADSNSMPIALYAPDGQSVIAYYPNNGHLWVLDPTGATPGRQLSLDVADVLTWQRVGH